MPATPTLIAFRFGYGLPLPGTAPTDPDAVLALLAGPDAILAKWAGPALNEVLTVMRDIDTARRASLAAPADMALREVDIAAGRRAEQLRVTSARIAVARALDSGDGLRERLVQFWSDHFTAAPAGRRDRALPGAMVEDAIRPHVNGRFADMLQAVTLHPAMLAYLSQNASIGPNSVVGKRGRRGLNENLGREVMELHSMGVGSGYSQDDVRQMAELLTGLTFNTKIGFQFEPKWAEPGPETVLGHSYHGPGTDPILRALNDLAARPETARHLAHKLAVHFTADAPEPDLVAAMAAAYETSGGGLMPMVRVLLAHPSAWAEPAVKVRQPFEFVVAGLRGLGLTGHDVMAMPDKDFRRAVAVPMQAMGQPWQAAPGPDGWPEEPEAWISPTRLAARITWAMALPQRLVKPLPDPRDFAAHVLGDRAGPALVQAAARAENRRDGVGIILASPEFNRR